MTSLYGNIVRVTGPLCGNSLVTGEFPSQRSVMWRSFDVFFHLTLVMPGAGRQHPRELMSTTQTYPWLIPIITWCRQFPVLSTNNLLIKSKLKLKSRAIAVRVAMSPRNLGGKYHGRPHPRSWKMHTPVFCGKQSLLIELHQSSVIAWQQRSQSCGVFKSLISVAHCPFQWKWRVLHNWYICT